MEKRKNHQTGNVQTPNYSSLIVNINNTFSKTLQNVETMFWVKSEVYVSPTFFTIESMRYNTGSLISARTYRNNTNILGGVVVCWGSNFLPVLTNSTKFLHYYCQESQTYVRIIGPKFSKAITDTINTWINSEGKRVKLSLYI